MVSARALIVDKLYSREPQTGSAADMFWVDVVKLAGVMELCSL